MTNFCLAESNVTDPKGSSKNKNAKAHTCEKRRREKRSKLKDREEGETNRPEVGSISWNMNGLTFRE